MLGDSAAGELPPSDTSRLEDHLDRCVLLVSPAPGSFTRLEPRIPGSELSITRPFEL
ncbi:zf-HC2 domain-containing protein [Pseudomonas cichorii]|nr:zf-HC2 domain-containing protein [Pseudomonas cichorii]